MRVSNLLAAAGAILALSAGAALAAEGCDCCKDMAADAAMSCCDKMKSDASPPAEPAPPAPAPSPYPRATKPPATPPWAKCRRRSARCPERTGPPRRSSDVGERLRAARI